MVSQSSSTRPHLTQARYRSVPARLWTCHLWLPKTLQRTDQRFRGASLASTNTSRCLPMKAPGRARPRQDSRPGAEHSLRWARSDSPVALPPDEDGVKQAACVKLEGGELHQDMTKAASIWDKAYCRGL